MDEIRKRFQQVTDMGVSIKACVAELLGTCLFVLIGLLSIVYSSTTPDDTTNTYVTSFCVAFTFGIAITCMVYMTAHSSGGQLNPAITAGCMAAGATTPVQGVANIISQCVGTIISAILLIILVPASLREGLDLGVNQVPETSNVHRAVVAEAIGMFIVVLTVLETACHNKSTSGHSTALAIGLTFVVVILAFGGVSSGSFNPARSLGPALVSGNLKNLWVFILGPVIGGVAAAPVHLASLSGADTKRAADAGPSTTTEPLLAEA